MTVLHLVSLGWIVAVVVISITTVRQMCAAHRAAQCQVDDEHTV